MLPCRAFEVIGLRADGPYTPTTGVVLSEKTVKIFYRFFFLPSSLLHET